MTDTGGEFRARMEEEKMKSKRESEPKPCTDAEDRAAYQSLYMSIVPGTFEPNGSHPMCKECVLFNRRTCSPEAVFAASDRVAKAEREGDRDGFLIGVVKLQAAIGKMRAAFNKEAK